MNSTFKKTWELFFLFLGMIIPALANAQEHTDTVQVKDAGKKIKSSQKRYLQFTETKDGFIQSATLLTRTVGLTTYQDRSLLLVIQKYQSGNSIDTDSSYCEKESLLPVAYFTDIVSEKHRERVVFADSIINETIFADSLKIVRKKNTGRYNGVITDELIATLPLGLHKKFVFRTVNPGLRYFEYATTVYVEAMEQLWFPSIGKINCWKLKVSQGGDSYAYDWYTVKAQEQVKKKFIFKNGSSFNRVWIPAGE